MKIYKKKWLLEIRRLSGIRSHFQRKRRNEGICYYRWRTYRKAFDKFIKNYQASLLEAFAIPATEEDEIVRHLIVEAACQRRKQYEQERSI